MTSMSPTPPPIRPSFEDKMTPGTTSLPDNVVIHEGKKYKVETQIIQHGTIWKVWQGTQAIFLSIFSLGIGLSFHAWRDAIKNKWHQATTGEETVFLYKRLSTSPPEIETTTKATQLGATLRLKEPSPKFPITVRNLLDEAKKDITVISIVDLEKGLEEALKVGAEITDPDDKTTLLTISETVAQHYVLTDFDKAIELRIKTAQTISPAPPLSELSHALKTEDPKLGMRLQPVDTSLFKNQTLAVQKCKYTDGKTHIHLNAKISHPARGQLTSTLDGIEADPKKLLHALPKGFCTNISVTDDYVSYEGRKDAMGKKWSGDFSSDLGKDGYALYFRAKPLKWFILRE